MEDKELLRTRPSIMVSPPAGPTVEESSKANKLLFLPPLGIVLVWIVKVMLWTSMHDLIAWGVTGLMVLLIVVAWIRTRLYSFGVRENVVFARRRLLSTWSNEIRIPQVRSIKVTQTFFQWITRISDVNFVTAGDHADVKFFGVRGADAIRNLVQAQQSKFGGDASEEKSAT